MLKTNSRGNGKSGGEDSPHPERQGKKKGSNKDLVRKHCGLQATRCVTYLKIKGDWVGIFLSSVGEGDIEGDEGEIWWLNLFVGDWSGRGRKELTVGTMLWMLWSTLAKTHASGHVSSCCASIFQFCRRASAFYATRCFSADQG